VFLTKYYSGDPMKVDEMVGTCGTYEGKGEMHTWFWWGIGRRIILKRP